MIFLNSKMTTINFGMTNKFWNVKIPKLFKKIVKGAPKQNVNPNWKKVFKIMRI